MSQQRKERKQQRVEAEAPSRRDWGRVAIYVVVIVAAFGLAYYLGYRSSHKYDAFARCLGDRGLKMYGAFWCEHCADQKKKFSASFEYAPYVECGVKGDTRAVAQACKDAGIKHYPTWQFPPTGERVERVFTLEELSDRSGCSLP
jgi:hypothetical protein